MTAPPGGGAAAWEQAGARCAAGVEATAGAVVVLGHDRDATAAAALGLARALGAHQRVALADLLGDAPQLQSLTNDPEAPGISDSFVHGVSLNEVAQPVVGEAQLFVLPAGLGEVATPHILGSKRWERLARGFREVGARLVLVVRTDAVGAESLAQRLGGAVVVGPDVVLGPDVPTLAVAMLEPGASPAPIPGGTPTPEASAPIWSPRARLLPDPRRLALLTGTGAIAIALAAVFWREPGNDSDALTIAPADTEDVATSAPVGAALAPPANPEDSTRASRFAVELVAANTFEGARLVLRQSLPSGTVAPAMFGTSRAPWFRVVAGAYGTRREADSLLAVLVRLRRVADGAGRVLELPLAFVVQEGVPRDSASAITNQWVQQGLPAYSLVQDDGRVTIFAGAFERLEQGAPLVAALVAAGVAPVTAYRLGRMF